MNSIMEKIIKRADETMHLGNGGPFGSAILDKDDNIIAISSNSVLKDNDPTAHGEINAIRKAGKALGTFDLTGCKLYTTAYPCPMCLGAIMWSNRKEVDYGCTAEDTGNIGFRDDFMYKFINNGLKDTNILKLEELDRKECQKLFETYEKDCKKLY